jgi:predicted transcriptional regulator
MSNTVQLNARVDKDIADQLDRLAAITGRKKVWHLNEALRAYIEYETQFIEAVERGRADARAGRVRDFEEYAAELKQRIDRHRAQ